VPNGSRKPVQTTKRDYVNGAELRDAETVLAQRGDWIDDYNTQAPHAALGMQSPAEPFARTRQAAGEGRGSPVWVHAVRRIDTVARRPLESRRWRDSPMIR
jgi:hypothetical protein